MKSYANFTIRIIERNVTPPRYDGDEWDLMTDEEKDAHETAWRDYDPANPPTSLLATVIDNEGRPAMQRMESAFMPPGSTKEFCMAVLESLLERVNGSVLYRQRAKP